MTRALIAAIAALTISTAAHAAEPALAAGPDQLRAACTTAGFKASESSFDVCVESLKQAVVTMPQGWMGRMSTRACTEVGLKSGTPAFASCVDNLHRSLEDEAATPHG